MPSPNDCLSSNYDVDVAHHFSKKFQFRPERWICVSPDEIFKYGPWKVERMMMLKNELNSMKNRLNDFDLKKWHQHTKTTNLSGNIIPYLKKCIKPEFVTQAWCKFYEICSYYHVIPQEAIQLKILNSMHLCEAPGAFIAALNHYLKSNHPAIQWEWIGTTFNPYYEENDAFIMINDDRFMLLTADHWKFGPDNTGDLTKIDNLKQFIAESRKLGPILLVTADGSFDCQDRPDEQEATVAPLIFCEIIAALHILSIGGTFIFKAFTMFEHATICLMYLLNCCFESVHVCKPVTSKEGNSENYVICLNYIGTEKNKPWLRKLRQFYGSDEFSSHCLFPLKSIPESFIKQQLECSEFFKRHQEYVLERNIMNFVIDFSSGSDKYRSIRKKVCDIFMNNCQLKPLQSEVDEIVGKSKLAEIKPLQLDNRFEEGTFTDRVTSDLLPLKDKLSKLIKRIKNIELRKVYQAAFEFPSTLPAVKIVKGKPVNVIKSSKFCSGQIINFRLQMNNLIELAKVEKTQTGINVSKTISLILKTSLTRKNPNALRQECVQFNFGENLWLEAFTGNYNKCERVAVSSIIRTLDDTWRDCNFIIEGFPMLTQYSVGFIFILGHLFKEVHFIWPDEENECHGVLFCGFKSRNPLLSTVMSELASEADESNDDLHSSVHSIIPIYHLVENNRFYEAIVSYNTNTLRHQLVCDGKLIEASIAS